MKIKRDSFDKVNRVNRWSTIFLTAGIIFGLVIFLMLFTSNTRQVTCTGWLAVKVTGNDFPGEHDLIGGKLALFLTLKVIEFLQVTCYIFVGSSVIYYKDSLKIDSSQALKKIAYISLIIMGILLVLNMAFFVWFTLLWSDYYDNSGRITLRLISLLLGLFFILFQLSLFIIFFRNTKQSLDQMLLFHDYLISYRLTPRSRIMRKHLPRMSMVIEEESNFDTSSYMQSQHLQQSTLTHHQRSKFVFKDQTNDAPNILEDMDFKQLTLENDSSSSSDEIDED